MKKISFLAGVVLAANSFGQWSEATFELPALPAETAWYGQDQVTDGDTIYAGGGYNFELNYNSAWMISSGWSVSNITDNVTPGWSNSYSAITGQGQGSSVQYGVCYVSQWDKNRIFYQGGQTGIFDGFYATNSTYAYFSMLNGDAFAKPFGADTSAAGVIDGTNGEDWFLLTVYGLDTDSLYTGDSVNFYLADYRFAADSLDYILDEWTWVDLSSLGEVHGLDFVLNSSDTSGGWGMNTPSYFAMDNLSGGQVAGTNSDILLTLNAYPNPSNGWIIVNTQPGAMVEIVDLNGRLIYSGVQTSFQEQIDLTAYPSGIYLLRAIYAKEVQVLKIILE